MNRRRQLESQRASGKLEDLSSAPPAVRDEDLSPRPKTRPQRHYRRDVREGGRLGLLQGHHLGLGPREVLRLHQAGRLRPRPQRPRRLEGLAVLPQGCGGGHHRQRGLPPRQPVWRPEDHGPDERGEVGVSWEIRRTGSPFDRIRTALMKQGGSKQYEGFTHCAAKLAKQDGIASF